MIDTIKLLIPIDDQSIILKLKGSLSRFKKENLKEGTTEFEFYTANIELGSYKRTVAVKSTNNPTGFFIEFSVPKYSKGNNVEMVYPHDLVPILNKLHTELCDYMGYPLTPISTWPIYRLDVSYNWLLKSEEEALQAIDFVKRIDYPRKDKHLWNTSVMYRGTSYTIKFYLKGAEFRKHDFRKIDFEKAVSLQSWANRILRFEVNLKREYIQEHFGREKVFIQDITEDYDIQEILIFYLNKVFFYINQKTMSESEVEAVLFEKFSKAKATRLYQFYKGYYFDDAIKNMFIRGGLNRSTIYRCKKDLKLAGIGFSAEHIPNGASILEQLIIPSPNTKFDLLDYDVYS